MKVNNKPILHKKYFLKRQKAAHFLEKNSEFEIPVEKKIWTECPRCKGSGKLAYGK